MNVFDQIKEWRNSLKTGSTRGLAQAITLIESQLESDQEKKVRLLQSIKDLHKPAVKIGVTGSPGVGKSTFLNTLVSSFKNKPQKVAILTIDPSSQISGGSILGDKLRMTDLANMSNVYIRPSASKGILGGINVNTWESVLLCEASGYDYIFIETVGVGQSETEIQYLTNEVWYLTMPRSGDEIQGIKKGILEVVDRVIVTKKDMDPYGAQKTGSMLRQSLISSDVTSKNISFYEVSSLNADTMDELFSDLCNLTPEPFSTRQLNYWFEKEWKDQIILFFESDPELKNLQKQLKNAIMKGDSDYWQAIKTLINELELKWYK